MGKWRSWQTCLAQTQVPRGVEGSSPSFPTLSCRSSAAERPADNREAGGAIPSGRTFLGGQAHRGRPIFRLSPVLGPREGGYLGSTPCSPTCVNASKGGDCDATWSTFPFAATALHRVPPSAKLAGRLALTQEIQVRVLTGEPTLRDRLAGRTAGSGPAKPGSKPGPGTVAVATVGTSHLSVKQVIRGSIPLGHPIRTWRRGSASARGAEGRGFKSHRSDCAGIG